MNGICQLAKGKANVSAERTLVAVEAKIALVVKMNSGKVVNGEHKTPLIHRWATNSAKEYPKKGEKHLDTRKEGICAAAVNAKQAQALRRAVNFVEIKAETAFAFDCHKQGKVAVQLAPVYVDGGMKTMATVIGKNLRQIGKAAKLLLALHRCRVAYFRKTACGANVAEGELVGVPDGTNFAAAKTTFVEGAAGHEKGLCAAIELQRAVESTVSAAHHYFVVSVAMPRIIGTVDVLDGNALRTDKVGKLCQVEFAAITAIGVDNDFASHIEPSLNNTQREPRLLFSMCKKGSNIPLHAPPSPCVYSQKNRQSRYWPCLLS